MGRVRRPRRLDSPENFLAGYGRVSLDCAARGLAWLAADSYGLTFASVRHARSGAIVGGHRFIGVRGAR